jgi:pyruvate formate lyase activating enzyme
MTSKEVYENVKKQIPFIRGITVSGGECMLQPHFLEELFKLAKEDDLETLIDSNGTIPFWDYPKLLELTDGVMLDIKAFNSTDFFRVTGSTNKMVLKNAEYLAKASKLDEVRIVVVQELYDAEESVLRIGQYLKAYVNNQIRFKLISYRPIGVREQYSHYKSPSLRFMERLANILKNYGFENVIII